MLFFHISERFYLPGVQPTRFGLGPCWKFTWIIIQRITHVSFFLLWAWVSIILSGWYNWRTFIVRQCALIIWCNHNTWTWIAWLFAARTFIFNRFFRARTRFALQIIRRWHLVVMLFFHISERFYLPGVQPTRFGLGPCWKFTWIIIQRITHVSFFLLWAWVSIILSGWYNWRTFIVRQCALII